MAHLHKIVRSAAAAALTLALTTGIASAAYGTGTVTAKSLRLRSEAATTSSTLAILARGTEVEVLEDMVNGWFKVSYGEKTGYMSAEYLTVIPTEETDAPAPAYEEGDELEEVEDGEEDEDTVVTGRVSADVLNIRSGAGTGFEKVGKLSGGTVVTILDEADGWYHISTGAVEGYVSAEYLNIIDPEAVAAAATEGARLVELAKQYLGVRYVYGGTSPSGFDCSGFVYYLTKTMGYSVPRTASSQWGAGYTKVSKAELQPGDLVFFTKTYHSSKYITHVGIYVGDGKFIHASSPSSGGVIITSLTSGYYASRFVGGCRIFE